MLMPSSAPNSCFRARILNFGAARASLSDWNISPRTNSAKRGGAEAAIVGGLVRGHLRLLSRDLRLPEIHAQPGAKIPDLFRPVGHFPPRSPVLSFGFHFRCVLPTT